MSNSSPAARGPRGSWRRARAILYVVGTRPGWPADWVVKRAGLDRAERDRTPPAGGAGKR